MLFPLQLHDFQFCGYVIFLLQLKKLNFTTYLFQSSGKLPVESSSVDFVILVWQSLDSIDQLIQEVLRVLKVGGTTLIRKPSQSAMGSDDKVVRDRMLPE